MFLKRRLEFQIKKIKNIYESIIENHFFFNLIKIFEKIYLFNNDQKDFDLKC